MKVKLLLCCGLIMIYQLCLTGCASLQHYGKNRLYDFADMFCFEASKGQGMDVHCHLTDLFGTGLGFSYNEGAAMQGRYVRRTERGTLGLLVFLNEVDMDPAPEKTQTVLGHLPDEEKAPEYISKWYAPNFSILFFIPACGSPEGAYVAWFKSYYWKNHWLRILDLQAGGSAWFGFHVGFSPGELLDFLLGITTLDIASDDELPDQAHPDPAQ